MNKFQIDSQYLCNVHTVKEVECDNGRTMKMHGTDDHDEFKKLRNQLEQDGFIECQRGWWNGDRVLKQFYLNGHKFKIGQTFPCGAAMGNTFIVHQGQNQDTKSY